MARVLVTGADGFIGSHLCELLVEAGHEVTALAQYNSRGFWGWLEDVAVRDALRVVSGDIRDPRLCRQLVTGQEQVFHLAALIAIPYSYQAPHSYLETNVTGTLNLVEAARDAGVTRFVQTSTSEVYGTAQYVPIDEAHPLQPQSPYSASKIAADAMALSYHHTFQLPVVVARPFNTYGPRQSARAVIPSIIAQVASGRTTLQLGDTTPTRDFNYVTDTCRGLVALAGCDEALGQAVNIGSNSEISIHDLVMRIGDLMGTSLTIETDAQRLRPAGSEVFRLWCDNTRIQQLVGYAPAVSLDAGLAQTIAWFQDPRNLAHYKPELYAV